MTRIEKLYVADGLYLVRVPDADLRILCGCPADSVKHLMKRGLIHLTEKEGVRCETGPNAVLLSDVLVQNGSFANLAEFPVLQMLYRQGMIVPGHPNNTGDKPLLIGLEKQVRAQIEYIYRGNYGLVSEEEIVAAGIPGDVAHDMMRLKLKFAFGRISPADELLDTRIVDTGVTPLRNGVTIRRLRLNVFEIAFGGESVTVDLNLSPEQSYTAPYTLGFHLIKREYFAVIHSGEGDGWNVNHPCMSSILMFQGKIYLIDAGPNVLYTLTALGIGVNEVEGIFHTHAHDDHIAGFTMLMRSDRRIKYFAAPLVRASVARKLSALMDIPEDGLFDYFEVWDLAHDEWNNIDGLEVRPVFSPHPVETTILTFRTLWIDGFKTYAHFADIVALDVLRGMIATDDAAAGISQEYYERIRDIYLTPCDIKKLDVGGGMIHGNAIDFREDASEKIILSHTSRDLTNEQKEIGSGAPFGMVDVLIPGTGNYLHSAAMDFLRSYFPSTPDHALRILLNNDIVTYNPHSILIKNGSVPSDILLILTGNVERIHTGHNPTDTNLPHGFHSILSAGALIGELFALRGEPAIGTFRSANFVQALLLPRSLYLEFVKRHDLYDDIELLRGRRDFLQKTWLFGEVVSYPTQNRLAKALTRISLEKGEETGFPGGPDIFMVKSGRMKRRTAGGREAEIGPYDFWGEDGVLFEHQPPPVTRALENSQIYRIPGDMVRSIPVVRWKLFETYRKRTEAGMTGPGGQ